MAGSIARTLRSAVVDGLSDLLGGLPEFNGTIAAERRVQVAYSYDLATNAAERVWTQSARAETPPAALRAGRNYKDEAGQFFLVVLVACVGGSPEDADDRAFAIGEQIEDWLGDRKSNELGVTGLQTLTVRGWESENLHNDRGSMSELTYRVEWTARIT